MNKKSLTISLIALFCTITLVSFGIILAEAGWKNSGFGSGRNCGLGAPGPGPEMGPGFGKHLGRNLDLTTKQRQQMHKLQFAFLKKTIDLRDELGQKNLERKSLMETDPTDWKKVDQLTDEIAKLNANIEKERMRQFEEIKKILTPEQLEKFKDNFLSCPMGLGDDDSPGLPGRGLGCSPGKGMDM